MNIYNSKLKNFAALFFSSFLMLFAFTGFSSAQSAKSAIAGQARAAGISANIPQAAATAPAANKTARNPEREWLVMVYINAKNDLGLLPNAFMSVNDMERIGSTDKVAVVVEYGAFEKHNGISVHSEDSKTILIQKDNDTRKVNSPVINYTKRADMGDYSHLSDFASRAIKSYPAKHNMLVVWNHGKGIDGISFDDITGHHISVKELGIALNKIKDSLGRKLDMLTVKISACSF